MLKPCPSRWYYFTFFLMVAGLLVFAYYLENYQGLAPCALCELQRVFFAGLGFLFLLGTLLPSRRLPQILLNVLLVIVALLGILFAARQVFLQHLPPQAFTGTCEGSLRYLLEVMPWKDALLNVFLGGPECAKITWQFLGLSIAGWSLLWFIAFFVLALCQGLGWLMMKRREGSR